MVFIKKSVALSLTLITLGLSACGGGSNTSSGGSSPGGTINKPPIKGTVQLTGAGASFPAPLYQNWFVLLNRQVPELRVNYQSTGSGAGIEQFTAGTIDFGASDIAMTDEQLKRVSRGVLMLPVTAGSIVLAYNVPELTSLNLSQSTYVNIFLGKVTNWNDPQIAKDNPGAKLPDRPIIVVHRADGSGTTAVFTKNLSEMSPEWKKTIGSSVTVQWPKGRFIGSRGNEGVTTSVRQNPGSITYVEYGFAKNNKLQMAALGNKAGKFVTANEETGTATLAAVELPENLRAFIVNAPGDNSYPFVTYTWLLVYKKYDDHNKALAVKGMIDFAINDGQKQSSALGYIPLPKNVREKIAAAVNTIGDANDIVKDFTVTVR